MIISPTGSKIWINRHETFEQKVQNIYDLANNQSGNLLADYNDSTQSIQNLIKKAIDSSHSLRALGGEWSWSKVAATGGILLNTKPMNIVFQIRASNVATDYAQKPEDLIFAQCGVSVKELNNSLRTLGRSLKTTGASNGQTIAGALSTGTHGAAIDVGSIPDYVVGLHIVVSPTRHIWLERSSYPVVSKGFVDHLGAELVRNDDWFNAALVSFGCFGFIHGVMMETAPLFLYQAYRLQVPMNADYYDLLESLDFANTNVQLPFRERPYHFQTLINQYDSSNRAYVTVMYKRKFQTGYTPPQQTAAIGPGDDAPSFIGAITDAIPALVPTAVNKLIGTAYAPYTNVWGTHGEIFTNTDTHGKVLSSAIGVPVAYVNEVRELFLKVNESKGPFVGVLALRYVKGTAATLGFTKFPTTCVVELDSVTSNKTKSFYEAFWEALYQSNIPFTFHWGKLLQLDASKVRKLYTDQKVDNWLAARKALMQDPAAMQVFTNDVMVEWGLDAVAPPAQPVIV